MKTVTSGEVDAADHAARTKLSSVFRELKQFALSGHLSDLEETGVGFPESTVRHLARVMRGPGGLSLPASGGDLSQPLRTAEWTPSRTSPGAERHMECLLGPPGWDWRFGELTPVLTCDQTTSHQGVATACHVTARTPQSSALAGHRVRELPMCNAVTLVDEGGFLLDL